MYVSDFFVWAFLTHLRASPSHTSVMISFDAQGDESVAPNEWFSVSDTRTSATEPDRHDTQTLWLSHAYNSAWLESAIWLCFRARWCSGYDYQIRLQKPWSDGSKWTGSPCLTRSWAGRLERNSEKLQRTSCIALIQLQLCMCGRRCLIDRCQQRKRLLDSYYECVGETGVTNSAVSPELGFSPPDECLPSV